MKLGYQFVNKVEVSFSYKVDKFLPETTIIISKREKHFKKVHFNFTIISSIIIALILTVSVVYNTKPITHSEQLLYKSLQ